MPSAWRSFEWLGAISLLVQTAEFLRLSRATSKAGVWSWAVQRDDLAHASPQLRKVADRLYADMAWRVLLWSRAAIAATLFVGGTPLSALFLFLSGIAVLIRWRGAFNGGSDFMTLVFSSALVVAHCSAPVLGVELAFTAALWFACIQAVTSYFISGAIKLASARWRSGEALTHFLDGGLYGPLPPSSKFRRLEIAAACSWAFIFWEIAFPLALIAPEVAVVWCAVACVFHLLVFRYFGLNRFFWAWMTMFPAIVHCAGRW